VCYTNFPSTKGEKPRAYTTAEIAREPYDPRAVYGPFPVPTVQEPQPSSVFMTPSEALICRFDAAVKDLCCTVTDLERRLESSIAYQESAKAATPNMKDAPYSSPLLRRLDELVGAVEGQIAVMQRLLGRLEV